MSGSTTSTLTGTPVYAWTRARDPSTGALLMVENQWKASTSPMVEIISMVLRTPLGACLVEPTLGVDWSGVNKLGTGAAATARAAITKALQRFAQSGQITGLSVEAEVDASSRGVLRYKVTFTDPRLSRSITLRGVQ